MRKLIAILLALIASSVAFGQESGVLADLRNARARWETSGPRDYAFTIQQRCFCGGHASLGPARITVSGGHVVRATYLGNGQGKYRKGRPLAPNSRELAVTVPELFKLIEMMINGNDPDRDDIHFSFHPDLGFPTRIATSNRELEDDFLVYELTEFAPQ